jgi:hypothetical protein
MKNKNSKKHANVYRCTISESNFKLLEFQYCPNECNLHWKHKKCLIKYFNLVIWFKFMIKLYSSHVSKVWNSINIWWQFHHLNIFLYWFLFLVFVVIAAYKKYLTGSFSLIFCHSLSHNINTGSQNLFILVETFVFYKFFMKYDFFFPF